MSKFSVYNKLTLRNKNQPDAHFDSIHPVVYINGNAIPLQAWDSLEGW